jgi:hypothetical protein
MLMIAWNPNTVLRRRDASIVPEATIVYAQKDMRETGKIMEQDAVRTPVPNQGMISWISLH